MDDRTRTRGVVSMILQMSRDSTDFYKEQNTWLVISFLYLSAMYISEVPWLTRKNDFQCHGNISDACVTECYNKHFSLPMIGVWNAVGLTVYSVFFMMEFSVFRNLTITSDYAHQSLEDEPCHSPLYDENDAKREEVILSLSKEKFLLSAFLAYYVGQMAIQGVFLIVLWVSLYKAWLVLDFILNCPKTHKILCLRGPGIKVNAGGQYLLLNNLPTRCTLCVFGFGFSFALFRHCGSVV
ncbi:hypothetical protein STEG23_009979 [Scotinomys teguina]